MPNIGGLPPVPGAGSGVGITAGAPVTVGLTPGLEGAAGNGLAGTFPGAYLIIKPLSFHELRIRLLVGMLI